MFQSVNLLPACKTEYFPGNETVQILQQYSLLQTWLNPTPALSNDNLQISENSFSQFLKPIF